MTSHAPSDCLHVDVAIIGAGVTGVAIARRFAIEGKLVAVIERGSDILSGASKANSAILHTGFDAPPGSLELELVQEGWRAFNDLATRHRLAKLDCGAVLVAWNESELAALPGLLAIAHGNGVTDCRLVDKVELARIEPHLGPAALGGMVIPGESIIDPWSPFLAYMMQAIEHGATLLTDAAVTDARFDGSRWLLETARTKVSAASVIACAGANGDHINRMLLDEPLFAVKPRKGQFIVYDKASANLVRGIILPVPNERTKGVVVTRTVFGNVLVGPTAEEQDERDRPSTSREGLEGLAAEAARLVPGLAQMPVTATYAGIRPATDRKEYRISHHPERHVIVVGGIRSTGLTASLGIANHVWALFAGVDRRQADVPVAGLAEVPVLADWMGRDWTQPGYGQIVCHCEFVTDREIRAAINGPVPAHDLAGVKRRTRCLMGRCQGFNCLSAVTALTGFATGPDGAGP